ncbi:multidrug resistance efflux pump [Agrilactobacillus composti DSM 18527 = JCM 14202]|uniref:Multidrug resistance efflux pump n=1 Tax=Agrilactobacillus composti DSM 18527 = JCM 14202 TaxID=1423734 RepID=A0A0R1XTC0_9LACO|nr:MFS transporter [Agrilactobacillus composti]KRM32885.1 multidrug resistance efflux pump [Agrilactobacillus composti DSM 18527 = JCM 14202]
MRTVLGNYFRRGWQRNLAVLWFGCFITGFGNSMTMPFLPLFIDTLGKFTPWQLNILSGTAFAITFLAKAVVSPAWGRLADRKGRRVMCLRAAGVMAVTITAIGFTRNVWLLIVLRGIQGGFSGYINNAQAMIATESPRDKKGQAMGTLATGQVTGTLLGPLIGGFLADSFGYRASFFIAGFLMLVVFLTTIFFVHEDFKPIAAAAMRPIKKVFHQLTAPRVLIGTFITTLVVQASASSIQPIVSLFVRQLLHGRGDVALISGVVSAAPGMATLIAASLMGRVIDHVGPQKILNIGLITAVLVLVPMIFLQDVKQFIFLRFLFGLSDAAVIPAYQTLMTLNSPADAFGRIFSYSQSFQAMGSVLGPMLGAMIASVTGYRSVFVLTLVLEVICLGYVVFAAKYPKRKAAA